MIEIADHADAPRIRGPDRKASPGHAAVHLGMRAELLMNVVMIALTEQVQIEIGERRVHSG